MYQVLIVGEDPGFLAITKIFLEHSGRIYADTAFTVDEALDLLLDGLYDAIVFSALYDGLTDGALLSSVRSVAGQLPVLLIVEEYQAEEGMLALKKGVSHVIVRTADPKDQFHELIAAIREQVDQSRSEVALRSHDAILSLVARSAERFLTVSVDMDEIASLFAAFGIATGIARASLVSLVSEDATFPVPYIVSSWNAEDIEPRLYPPDPVHIARMQGHVMQRITADIRKMNNFISSTREFSRDELYEGGFDGISAILAAPVISGGRVWGCIVIEDAERERYWSEIEIDAIRGMADIVGAALYSKAQKEHVRFLSEIVQQVSDAVIAYDHDYRIVYANAAAGSILGVDTGSLFGGDIRSFFQDDRVFETDTDTLSLSDVAVLETVDGREVLVDVKVTSLLCAKYGGASVAVLRDATERIRMHQLQSEALARVNDDISMMEQLGEKIRDPLTIILGHADFFDGEAAAIITSQVQEIQAYLQLLDSAQLKSSYYRKLLASWDPVLPDSPGREESR